MTGAMELFVARQPIFDRNLSVVAYELLYRSGATNVYDGTDPRSATAKVLNAVFYSPDGHNLLAGRPAFVNFPESLILDGTAFFFPETRSSRFWRLSNQRPKLSTPAEN